MFLQNEILWQWKCVCTCSTYYVHACILRIVKSRLGQECWAPIQKPGEHSSRVTEWHKQKLIVISLTNDVVLTRSYVNTAAWVTYASLLP